MDKIKSILSLHEVQRDLVYLYQQSQSEYTKNGKLSMEIGASREKDLIAILSYHMGDDVEYDIDIHAAEDVKICGQKFSIKHSSSSVGMGGMDLGFAGSVVVRTESVVEDMIESEYSIHGFVKLRKLPFEVIFQNDILPIAKSIAEWNRWNCSNYSLTDIRELLTSSDFKLPMVDVVIGGFPCQDFSHSGKRKGLTTERGTLYHSFIEVIKRCKPLVFVAENVHGLLTMKGVIETITKDFSNCGYNVEYQLVKCEEHGIPQTRWRTIIMGVRSDRQHLLENKWHLITENKVECPVGYYLEHLLEPGETTDPAQQVYSKASKLSKGQGQKEILLSKCSPTIRAEHHGNIEFRRVDNGNNGEEHLRERRLTLREVALIQTFPPDCILTNPNGRITSAAYKPIGNAVPPLLSYLIARKVHDILKIIS